MIINSIAKHTYRRYLNTFHYRSREGKEWTKIGRNIMKEEEGKIKTGSIEEWRTRK